MRDVGAYYCATVLSSTCPSGSQPSEAQIAQGTAELAQESPGWLAAYNGDAFTQQRVRLEG